MREAEQEFDGLEETESEGNDDVVPNIDLSQVDRHFDSIDDSVDRSKLDVPGLNINSSMQSIGFDSNSQTIQP